MIQEDNTGTQSVRDFAQSIIDLCADMGYWIEMWMPVNGKKVNLEATVTWVDGMPYGRMRDYPIKPLPKRFRSLVRR
jgi:hypothetical protein